MGNFNEKMDEKLFNAFKEDSSKFTDLEVKLLVLLLYKKISIYGNDFSEKYINRIDESDEGTMKNDILKQIKNAKKMEIEERALKELNIKENKQNQLLMILKYYDNQQILHNFILKIIESVLGDDEIHVITLILALKFIIYKMEYYEKSPNTLNVNFDKIQKNIEIASNKSYDLELQLELESNVFRFYELCFNFYDQKEVGKIINLFGFGILNKFKGLLPEVKKQIETAKENDFICNLYIHSVDIIQKIKKIKVQNETTINLIINYVFNILAFSAHVTGIYGKSIPLCFLLTLFIFDTQYFHIFFREFFNYIQPYERKFNAYLYRIQANISSFSNNKIKNPFPSDELFLKTLDISSQYFDKSFIIDMLSSNLYIPSMALQYQTFDQYLIDLFILFKINLSYNLWNQIHDELINIHISSKSNLSSITFSYIHNDLKQITIRIINNSPEYLSMNDLVVFLNVNQNNMFNIDNFCFASIIDISDDNDYLCKFIYGEPFNECSYNYILKINMKTSSNYLLLEAIFNLSQKKTGIPKTPMDCIWLGRPNNNIKSLNEAQKAMNPHYLLSIIDFHDIFISPEEISNAINNINKILSFSCGTISKLSFNSSSKLIDIKYPGIKSIQIKAEFGEKSQKFMKNNIHLNLQQQTAILSACFLPFTLIIGPPGTGKTETLLTITRLLYENLAWKKNSKYWKSNPRILICSHSNASLDNILIDLTNNSSSIDIFRFGRDIRSKNAIQFTFEGKLLALINKARKILNQFTFQNHSIQKLKSLFEKAKFENVNLLVDDISNLINEEKEILEIFHKMETIGYQTDQLYNICILLTQKKSLIKEFFMFQS